MSRYWTGDLHLGHARIIELCDRPFASVDEMNEVIIDNINATVSTSDQLIIVGDIVMGKLGENLQLLSRIHAQTIILIPGNHDRWSLAFHTRGDALTKRQSWARRYEEQRSPTTTRIMALTDRAPSVWRSTVGKYFVSMSHYPYEGDSHGDNRYGWLRPDESLSPLVHGHVHNSWQTKGSQFNVGVDVNDFKPVSEDQLEAWITSLLNDSPHGDKVRASVTTPVYRGQ